MPTRHCAEAECAQCKMAIATHPKAHHLCHCGVPLSLICDSLHLRSSLPPNLLLPLMTPSRINFLPLMTSSLPDSFSPFTPPFPNLQNTSKPRGAATQGFRVQGGNARAARLRCKRIEEGQGCSIEVRQTAKQQEATQDCNIEATRKTAFHIARSQRTRAHTKENAETHAHASVATHT